MKRLISKSTIRQAIALLVALMVLTCALFAQAAQPEITHRPPRTLPDTGKPIELEIKIRNFKKFDIPIHMHIIRDGKAVFRTTSKGTLDIYDVPTYSFTMMAPEERASYKFFFEEGNKDIVSERFLLERPCSPDLKPVVIPEAPKHLESQDLAKISSEVHRIELENYAYEQSIELIKKIKATVEEFRQ